MKKYLTFFLITFLTTAQTVEAQLDMAFIASFTGASKNSITTLSWTVRNNQGVKTFDIERSLNGYDFKAIAILRATGNPNTESYTFYDTIKSEKVMYRLRMLSKNQHEFFSNIVFVKSTVDPGDDIRIIGNPVNDEVRFTHRSSRAQLTDIKIYNFAGQIVLNTRAKSVKGNNLVTIPLGSGISPGIYVLEISDGANKQTEKFMKQ